MGRVHEQQVGTGRSKGGTKSWVRTRGEGMAKQKRRKERNCRGKGILEHLNQNKGKQGPWKSQPPTPHEWCVQKVAFSHQPGREILSRLSYLFTHYTNNFLNQKRATFFFNFFSNGKESCWR